MKDRLTKPIEYICATYSFEGLQKLLPTLQEAANIASVCDELAMRIDSELQQDGVTFDEWIQTGNWDYLGERDDQVHPGSASTATIRNDYGSTEDYTLAVLLYVRMVGALDLRWVNSVINSVTVSIPE